MSEDGAQGGTVAQVVTVRDIKPVYGNLWAVKIRTATGAVLTIVIDRQLATSGTVAMAAHVVAMLEMTNRLTTKPTHR